VSVEVRRVGPEATATVLEVVRAAFDARPALDPPADAAGETAETLRLRLEAHGGLLALVDGEPVGALVLDPEAAGLHLRRFGVVPGRQGSGVAGALVDAARGLALAEGHHALVVTAREELPATVRFWEHQGFTLARREGTRLVLRQPFDPADVDVVAADAEAMRALGESLASRLTSGDLVVLTGELGAGKTTFTQGIGRGLRVRGAVTSPTFVIARVHPSEVGGPSLVHADAYRLGGLAELDDLDLDTSLDDAVTVVEWGGGLAEGLADSRVDVRITRAQAGAADGALDPRRVEIAYVGPRWSADPRTLAAG
jgi:tRNA threonylcarbamoyladenosine biosynthesis protein TsaE